MFKTKIMAEFRSGIGKVLVLSLLFEKISKFLAKKLLGKKAIFHFIISWFFFKKLLI